MTAPGPRCVGSCGQRKQQIEDVLRALQKAEEARTVYDSACQALDQADSAVRETQIIVRDAQNQERDERDSLLEAFTRWHDQNTQMDIPQDIWLEIRRALTVYRVPADWSPVRNQIDECARTCESALQRQLLQGEATLNALQEEQREQERELVRLKAQPEPVPPRRDSTQAARLHLMLRGIPCAPLYELVDFAPGLPQEERDLLEAQLTDACLLDALVVPEEHLTEIRELLEAEEEQRQKLAAEQAAKQAWSALKEKSLTLSTGLPYERTVSGYEEARGTVGEYQDTLNDLERSRQQWDYAARSMEQEQDTIDEQRDQAGDQRRSNDIVRSSLQVSQSAAGALQAYLDRPENQARVRRLAELEREIEFQDQENREAGEACAGLKAELKSSSETIDRQENICQGGFHPKDEIPLKPEFILS